MGPIMPRTEEKKMPLAKLLHRMGVALAAIASLQSFAQGYPARPVTLVVPFAGGGPTDTIARIVGERIGKTMGQPVIVENTAGAGGTIAVSRVVRSAPDGYTLFIGHNGPMVIAPAMQSVQFDVLTDLEPIAMVATNPQIIVSNPTVPAKDLKELIAWARKEGDKVSAG